jgi:hypothetical protein
MQEEKPFNRRRRRLEIRGRLRQGGWAVLPALIPFVRDLLLSEEGEVLAETAHVYVGLDGFHT